MISVEHVVAERFPEFPQRNPTLHKTVVALLRQLFRESEFQRFAEMAGNQIKLNMAVECIAVKHQQATTIGRGVNQLIDDIDGPKTVADEFAHHFIVVTRDIDNPRSIARFLHQQSQHFVVAGGPDELAFHRPEIDDIADQVKCFALDAAQEIEQVIGATVLAAEVHIRDPDSAQLLLNSTHRHRHRGTPR